MLAKIFVECDIKSLLYHINLLRKSRKLCAWVRDKINIRQASGACGQEIIG
jgi:hypothetical protein